MRQRRDTAIGLALGLATVTLLADAALAQPGNPWRSDLAAQPGPWTAPPAPAANRNNWAPANTPPQAAPVATARPRQTQTDQAPRFAPPPGYPPVAGAWGAPTGYYGYGHPGYTAMPPAYGFPGPIGPGPVDPFLSPTGLLPPGGWHGPWTGGWGPRLW